MKTNLCLIFLIFLLLIPINVSAKTTIKVGYLPILDHLTLVVSHERDNEKFKEVNVELKMFKKWDDMAGALNAGVIDAGFILSTLAMDMFNTGSDIKTVLLAHRNGSAITVKKDSDIHSATGLKDKKVAIPHRKATHAALLDKYLRKEGLSLKNVDATVVDPPYMEESMKLGRIDAFIVAEPFGAKAHLHGVGRVLVLTKDIIDNHVECIVVVRNQFLKQNISAVQEWVESLIRSGKFIEKDKRETKLNSVSAIAKKYMGHDEEVVREGLKNPTDRILFDNLNPEISDFQKIADIAVQAGIIEKVDLEGFIDSRFYKKAKEK